MISTTDFHRLKIKATRKNLNQCLHETGHTLGDLESLDPEALSNIRLTISYKHHLEACLNSVTDTVPWYMKSPSTIVSPFWEWMGMLLALAVLLIASSTDSINLW